MMPVDNEGVGGFETPKYDGVIWAQPLNAVNNIYVSDYSLWVIYMVEMLQCGYNTSAATNWEGIIKNFWQLLF